MHHNFMLFVNREGNLATQSSQVAFADWSGVGFAECFICFRDSNEEFLDTKTSYEPTFRPDFEISVNAHCGQVYALPGNRW